MAYAMSTTKALRVPVALDEEGHVVQALTAIKGKHYLCPECKSEVRLRRGQKYQPHFYHLNLTSCTGESATHEAAKHLLAQQISKELADYQEVRWQVMCRGLSQDGGCKNHATLLRTYPIAAWEEVRLEVTYGTYRFDVAVIQADRVRFGFEVFYRHEVPEEKAEHLDVPWLELYAEDILEFRSRVPHRNGISDYLCQDCRQRLERYSERHSDDAVRNAQRQNYNAEVEQVQRTWKHILSMAQKLAQ